MSLNNIQLSGAAVANLYQKALVDTTDKGNKGPEAPKIDMPETPSPVSKLKYLGNSRSNITILVESDVTFLPDDQLQFLTKMLSACKLSLEDVAIVNCANQPATIASLQETLRPTRMLMLGVAPSSINLPFNFPHFKSQSYAGCTYLSAPSLYELNLETADAKMLKTKLWMSLKELFGI